MAIKMTRRFSTLALAKVVRSAILLAASIHCRRRVRRGVIECIGKILKTTIEQIIAEQIIARRVSLDIAAMNAKGNARIIVHGAAEGLVDGTERVIDAKHVGAAADVRLDEPHVRCARHFHIVYDGATTKRNVPCFPKEQS
jgi:hypothetical protein